MKRYSKKMFVILLVLTMLSTNLLLLSSITYEKSYAKENSLDTLDLLIVSYYYLKSSNEENNLWPDDDVRIKYQIPLYNSNNDQIAWYIELTSGAYTIINNNKQNPSIVEFGDSGNKLIHNILQIADDSHIIYDGPESIYTKSDIAEMLLNEEEEKDLYTFYPELLEENVDLVNYLSNSRDIIEEKYSSNLLMRGDGSYGFISSSSLPSGSYKSDTLNVSGIDWAITGDYSSFAEDHCGATCVTNLALYFAKNGYNNLKKDGSKDSTFKAVHSIIGNGPVASLKSGAKKYFSNRGYTLKSTSPPGYDGIKTAIGKDRPCDMLLCDALDKWHWVLIIGYREYSGNSRYVRIVNGWDNTTNRYFKMSVGGAQWISSQAYYIE